MSELIESPRCKVDVLTAQSYFTLQKKLYMLSKLKGGDGGEVIWTKSKRTAVYSQGTIPKDDAYIDKA